MTLCAMCCVRGPSSSTGRIAREGIDGQPHPEHLLRTPKPGAQFVQLKVREPEMAEGALVQDLSMRALARQPRGDRGLTGAEDPRGLGRVQPFCQRREHPCDLMRRGFQTVERSVMSSAERGVASLTTERLDVLGLAMLAIANQRVDVSIGDAAVEAPSVGTSEALGVHALGSSPTAFHLTPGTHRQWRWPSTRRGSGGESTGGAIVRSAHSPCFEMGRREREPAKTPQQRQREEEEEHEQEHVHLKGHKDPRCLNDAAWTIIKEE